MTLTDERNTMTADEKHETVDESNEETPEAPESTEVPEEQGDSTESTEDDTPAVAKLRREAAGHRARLREAEAERDAVTVQRDALAATVLTDALRGTGVSAELFAAGGHEVSEYITEDGTLDGSALRTAARETASKFGIRPGRSPHTGTGPARPEKGKTWGEVLNS